MTEPTQQPTPPPDAKGRSIRAEDWTGPAFKPASVDGQVHAPAVPAREAADVPAFKPAQDPAQVYAPVVPAVAADTYDPKEHRP